jgi:hypothetical protein
MLRFREHWPVCVATVLLWAVLAAVGVEALRATHGHLVYALDDPYIHMAMAKNLARHGVWGVTPFGFTSSSSSLLWTLTIGAFFKVWGIRDAVPFALNLILASATLLIVDRALRRLDVPASWRFLILVGVALATPLPALVFAGQEHVAHILATIVFVDLIVRLVATDVEPGGRPAMVPVAALAALLPLIRYEGLYACLLAGALLIVARRWLAGISVWVAAAVPVAVYGLVSVSQGWLIAPNSVLIKASLPVASSVSGMIGALGAGSLGALVRVPAVTFLLAAAALLFIARQREGLFERRQLWLALLVAMALIHLQFSQPRSFWLYRYEAYVVALGVIAVGAATEHLLRPVAVRSAGLHLATTAALILLAAVSPLRARAVRAITIVPLATKNIYEQQYQMGRFLKQFYEGQTVALNDIGAATYLADFRCLDLVGLADIDVARKKLAGYYVSDDIEEIVRERGVRIAIVYDYQLERRGGVPPGWLRAGSWTIRRSVVVGNPTVAFYAVDPAALPALVSNLRVFRPELPRGVRVRIAGG